MRGSDRHDIAIVGMSAVFPDAMNLQEFWRNNVNGVDAIREAPRSRWPHLDLLRKLPPDHPAYLPTIRGGFIPEAYRFDPTRFGIMPTLCKDGEADQFLVIDLVDRALQDAGVRRDDSRRHRTDLYLGRGAYAGGQQIGLSLQTEIFELTVEAVGRLLPDGIDHEKVVTALRETVFPLRPEMVSSVVPNIFASRAANRLDLRGAAYVIDAACASSLIAVSQAATRLRHGEADLAVAAAVNLNQHPMFWSVFTQLSALSTQGMIRPFDRRADGLLVGEGGGAVVMKRLSDARKDGDTVYAILKGVGISSDGNAVDIMAPSVEGQRTACERAYADARDVDPATIGFLEVHGTGTTVGDATEIRSIKSFFGTEDRPAVKRGLGSVKSMIGHTMPAAGMAAFIRAALALSNKTMPPSLHCEQPHEDMADAPFYVVTQTRPWIHNSNEGPRRAAVNSFGFGGINAHAILEEVPPVTSRRKKVAFPRPIHTASRRESELFLISAPDRDGLVARIDEIINRLEAWGDGLSDAELSLALCRAVDTTHAVKLAIVAQNTERFRDRLSRVTEYLDGGPAISEKDEGLFYSENAARPLGKVAGIFPGMGFPGLIGNYPEHLMELCLHYPEVRAEFDFFEERDRHPEDTVPTSAIFSPPATLPEEYREKLKGRLAPPKVLDEDLVDDLRAEERYLAAMGVTLANWASWVLLRKFDIPFACVAGQSQGDMAAICAAGAADFHDIAPCFWEVLNINPKDLKNVRLAFAWCPAERMQEIIADYPDIHVAIHMSPEACLFGGDSQALDEIATQLRADGTLVQLLPYPPIHTPAMRFLREEVTTSIDQHRSRISKPKMPVYSSITADRYPDDPSQIWDIAFLNLDQPLLVWQTLRRLYADGARIFVQVGGGHMSAHMKELIGHDDVITAAMEIDSRDPVTQMGYLCGTLFTSGIPLSVEPLFEYRDIAEIDFLAGPEPRETSGLSGPLQFNWPPLDLAKLPALNPPDDPWQFLAYTESNTAVIESPTVSPTATSDDDPADTTAGDATAGDAPVPPPVPHSLTATDSRTEFAAPESPTAEVTSEFVIEEQSDAPHEDAPHEDASDEDVIESAGFVDEASQATYAELQASMPLLGDLVEWTPDEYLLTERVLDLDDDLFLQDHMFIYAWQVKPMEHCVPVVPMTVSMEILAEHAAVLSPGLGLIGYENVRAMRWIALEDVRQKTLRIDMTVTEDVDGVRKLIGRIFDGEQICLSAMLLFSDSYREDLQLEFGDCSDGSPWGITPEEVYADRLMFHGPRFQVISGLTKCGNPAATGELLVRRKDDLFASNADPLLMTDPCLMDGIGQFVGFWVVQFGWMLLPTGVEKLEFYGPTPPVGTSVPIRMDVTLFEEETRRFLVNVEVEDGNGHVWMRLAGWSDILYAWSEELRGWVRRPDKYTVANRVPLPGLPDTAVCMQMNTRSLKNFDRPWLSRFVLSLEEQPEFEVLSDKRQEIHLLASRAVAKEAGRTWISERGGTGGDHPARLTITHDELGRPWFAPEGDPGLPRVSIAHTGDVYMALAGTEDQGLDIEPADRDVSEILDYFVTPQESQLLDPLKTAQPSERWELRLWCAKEAAAKVIGTGLQGRPKEFQCVDLDDDARFLIQHAASGQRIPVATVIHDGMVIAYTPIQTPVAVS